MMRVLFAALATALVLVGVQTWRIDRLKVEAAVLMAEARAADVWWAQARDDAQTAADRCLDRVASARLSAQRIETIIERPVHVDPQGCAVRELVPADRLRDALQPRPPAE